MTPKSVTPGLCLGVVILAAGCSRRMGRPKLLLPWGRTSVLGHLIRQWRGLEARQIGVVCASGDHATQAELDRLRFPKTDRILNPSPERGMFSSIQCAAQWPGWKKRVTHWAIALGDQPHLCSRTLRRAIQFASARPESICQPVHAGHRRHPVFLPKTEFLRLAASAAADLNQFLNSARPSAALCPLDDPGLDLDMDRPEEYKKALALAQRERAERRAPH